MFVVDTQLEYVSTYLPKEIRLQQQIVRDCYAGATVIKSSDRAEFYLPALSKKNENVKWKGQYLAEASFPPFVEEFIDDWVGMMNSENTKPTLKLDVAQEELRWLVEVGDKARGGLDALKVKINTEQCLVGQYVLVLDTIIHPDNSTQFTVSGFTSESIVIFFEYNGYDHLVCEEIRLEFDPKLLQNKEVAYYRIFGLDVIGYWTTVIEKEVWTENRLNLDTVDKIYPEYHGRILDRLPIVVINTSTLGIDQFTKVPTFALADLAIQVYIREARLAFGQRHTANPMLVGINVSGPSNPSIVRDGQALCNNPEQAIEQSFYLNSITQQELELGSDRMALLNTVNPTTPAEVKYVEVRASGLASMDVTIKRMIEYASNWDLRRLLSTTGTNASASAVSMRGQVGIADVQLVDRISCAGMTELLRIAAIWTGVSEEDAIANIEVKANANYVNMSDYIASNSPKDSIVRQQEEQIKAERSNEQSNN